MSVKIDVPSEMFIQSGLEADEIPQGRRGGGGDDTYE